MESTTEGTPRVGGDAEVRGRLHQPSGADPQDHRGRCQRRDGRGGGNVRHGRIDAQGRVRRRQTWHRRRNAPARRTARPIAMETGGIAPKAAWPRHGVRILGEGTDPSEPGRPLARANFGVDLLERLTSTSAKLPQGGGRSDR